MRIDYTISRIYASDIKGNRLVDALLQAEGISRDQNLDYTCGIFDADGNLIAQGRFSPLWASSMCYIDVPLTVRKRNVMRSMANVEPFTANPKKPEIRT